MHVFIDNNRPPLSCLVEAKLSESPLTWAYSGFCGHFWNLLCSSFRLNSSLSTGDQSLGWWLVNSGSCHNENSAREDLQSFLCQEKKKKKNQLTYDLAGKLMWSLIFLLFYLPVINTLFIILSKALPIRLMCLQLLGLFLLSFPKL